MHRFVRLPGWPGVRQQAWDVLYCDVMLLGVACPGGARTPVLCRAVRARETVAR